MRPTRSTCPTLRVSVHPERCAHLCLEAPASACSKTDAIYERRRGGFELVGARGAFGLGLVAVALKNTGPMESVAGTAGRIGEVGLAYRRAGPIVYDGQDIELLAGLYAIPSTVYQGLVGGPAFPMRADGSRSIDFFDLIKEIRDNGPNIRDLSYFKRSPWFSQGMEALLYISHRLDDAEYAAAVSWLAGQVKQISAIRSLSWRFNRTKVPLPLLKDTGLIYAYQLDVLHQIVKALGYKAWP